MCFQGAHRRVFRTVSRQASRRVSRRLSQSRALRRSLRAVFRQSVTHSCSVFTFLQHRVHLPHIQSLACEESHAALLLHRLCTEP